MNKTLLLLTVLVALGGCSRHYHPLEASKKAKLVSELISESEQCSGFRNRLASPTVDDDSVDTIYHEATMAHCIKKDV
jgi:hypothetical protein